MPAFSPTVLRALSLVLLGAWCAGHAALRAQSDPAPNSIAASAGAFTARRVFWTKGQTPADLLETAGQHTKARWRLLYRPQPAPPTPDRNKAAFTLGGLIGDSFLVLQAGDSQQFRNNNQEIIAYCRMLGLGERIMPRLMTQAKMAEAGEWKELRREISEGQQDLTRMLREQMDEDLAVLVELGVWMRSLEIVSTLAMGSPDVDVWPLCIGSPALLRKLSYDFATLSESTRNSPLLTPLIDTLGELSVDWGNPNQGPPTQEDVAESHERIRSVMAELTLR